jgi:hypothetical protein
VKIGGFDLRRVIEKVKNTDPSHVLAQAQEKTQAMRCRVHGKAASLSLRKDGGQTMMAISTCCSGFQKEVSERIFHE